MQSSNLQQAENILQNLSHDLRQSLGTIEVSAYVLNRSLPEADAQVREHIRTIERQVQAASTLLRDALAAMSSVRIQPEAGESRELTNSATAGLT
jgi:signal transduction histidine kinase